MPRLSYGLPAWQGEAALHQLNQVLDRYLKQMLENARGKGPWLLKEYSIAEVINPRFQPASGAPRPAVNSFARLAVDDAWEWLSLRKRQLHRA